MGSRIPEFVTRTLASSVVGTRGLDTSKANLFDTVSSAAGSFANTAFSELNRKKVERDQVMDQVSTDATSREYEGVLETETQGIQARFADNPTEALEEYDKISNEKLNETINGIPMSRVKGMVSSRVSSINRVVRTGMKKWIRDQQVRNTGVNFSKVDIIEANDLRQKPDIEAWRLSILRGEARSEQAKQIYNPTQAVSAMERSRASRTKGFILGLMEQDPVEGAKLLKDGTFNNFLEPDEIHRLEKDMKGAVEGAKDQQEYNDQIDTISKFQGAEQLLREGNLTVDYVDGVRNQWLEGDALTPEREEALDDLREIATKNVDLKSTDSQDVLLKLQAQRRDLNIDSDKKSLTGSSEEVNKYVAAVNKDFKDGNISANSRIDLLDDVMTPYLAALEADEERKVGVIRGALTFKKRGDRLEPETPYDAAYNQVQDWVNSNNFSTGVANTAKARMMSNILTAKRDAAENGIIVTIPLMDSFFLIERQNEIARQNGSLRDIPERGKAVRLQNGLSVIVNQDGSISPLNENNIKK